uniref:Uncharacterized protein n=1 Tax=Meloidogyne enterolobii TaxID=390850 RepID=A0A6V7VBX1_MELEN|nr:unnamed protein product [Meloidogyne enterolobii]
MIILLSLIIFGIIPISKLASQTNTNENKFSLSNPGSSSYADISSKSKFTLNPNASEYIPAIEQQVIHRQLSIPLELSLGQLTLSMDDSLNKCFVENPYNLPFFLGQNLWENYNFSENITEEDKNLEENFNSEWVTNKIINHFDKFGWPEEEKILTKTMKYMLSINLLADKINWIFETLDSNNLTKESQPDFGHLDNKEMIKTVLLLEEYAKCVSKWNNKAILTLTGPIFVIPESSAEETKLRGRVKGYTFNNSIKQPPITQFYQVIFIKYENKKYCADIIFTEAKTKIKIFDTNKEDYCGKSSIDNWEYKDYVKDSKLMEQIFENKLRFLEWYIGFELVELINAAGIEGISDLEICTEDQLFKNVNELNKESEFSDLKSNQHLSFLKTLLPTFSNKFTNFENIKKENTVKYSKSNIRIYKKEVMYTNGRPDRDLQTFIK